MKKLLLLLSIVFGIVAPSTILFAQRSLGGHALVLDQNGFMITVVPPPGLSQNYTWFLPPYAPPPNTAFTEAGILEGQTLRWNHALGYYVPTSALLIQASGELTLDPGAGNNVFLNNIVNDDATLNFLTIDGSNRIRYRSLASILGVNANEGLVYNVPNIKLGATDGTTNPFITNRFVNLDNNSLTFTTAGGGTSLIMFRGSDGNVGIGTSTPNNFKLEVAGNVGPSANNTFSLGTNTQRWNDLFLGPNSLYIGNGAGDQTKQSYSISAGVSRLSFDIDDNSTTDLYIEESGLLNTNGDIDADGSIIFGGDLMPDGNAGTSGQYLKSNGAGTTPTWTTITQSAWGISGNNNVDSTTNFIGSTNDHDVVFKTNGIPRAKFMNSTGSDDSGAFIPWRDDAYQLGTEEHRWRDVYVGPGSLRIGSFQNGTKGNQSQQTVDQVTLSYTGGNLVIDKPVANFGSMVPNADNILELGSSTNRWADMWLGPNSLHIGTDTYEGSISFDPIAKELKFNSNNTIGSSEMKIDSNGNIIVLSLSSGGLLKANVGGMITIASGGSDFESPLTFNNGLTRTVNNVALGGTLTSATDLNIAGYNLTFTRTTGNIGIGTGGVPVELLSVGTGSAFQVNAAGAIAAATGITSSGTITFSGLGTGVVHSTSGTLSVSAVDLATEVTNTLGVPNGGTGHTSVTSQALLVGNGASALNELTIGTNGDILTVVSGAPVWQSPSTSNIATGTGTANTLAMWTSANVIGDAPMTVASGNVSFTGAISNATSLTSGGTITFSGLGTGVVHSTTGVLSVSAVNLATEVTNTLGVSNGGTGLSSVGTDGSVLAVVSGSPAWQTLTTDATLSGNGTSSTFSLNEANANTWTALQTFSNGASVSGGLTIPSGTNPFNVAGDDGTADEILTSQGTNSPEWKSPSEIGIVTGSGNSTELAFWNGSNDITSSSDLTYDGTTLSVIEDITVGQSASGGTNVRINITDGHLRSQQTNVPTEAEQTNIGTGGTSTLANTTDVAGKITIATGTGPAAGAQTIITFNLGYNVAPIATLTPMNAASAAIQAYVTTTATTMTISFGVAPAASTTYEFFYHVIETE